MIPGDPLSHTFVCWSRMGAESGEQLDLIVARKEAERLQNGGVFFWGIGNALGLAPRYALSVQRRVPVLFSRMKTPANGADEKPNRTVRWTKFITADGLYDLPDGVCVTSRAETLSGRIKDRHYALVCESDRALSLGFYGTFSPSSYRTLATGAVVGSSQVTAMLQRAPDSNDKNLYEVNLFAWLSSPYFVQLAEPVDLEGEESALSFSRLIAEEHRVRLL